MRLIVLIAVLILTQGLQAQDKLFFTNGTTQTGRLISIGRDFVFFKLNDSSALEKIDRWQLVMVEDQAGLRHIFAAPLHSSDSAAKKRNSLRNAIGIQPLNILSGRVTLGYERFGKDGKIGILIPFSLTFDPLGTLHNARLDTSRGTPKPMKGINFITGFDLNFYVGKSEHRQFFIGPRFRYGTDLLFFGTQAYTFQSQFGWRYGGDQKKLIQHFSLGFGFARILTSPLGRLISPQQSYPWFSLNYRISIRW